jgi:hypothetical protein
MPCILPSAGKTGNCRVGNARESCGTFRTDTGAYHSAKAIFQLDGITLG